MKPTAIKLVLTILALLILFGIASSSASAASSFLRPSFSETQIGNEYQALVSIKNQSVLSLCLQDNTISHCVYEYLGQSMFNEDLTPEERDQVWLNNRAIVPKLESLFNVEPITISAVNLLKVIPESSRGYRTLLTRVGGVEYLQNSDQCLGDLAADQSCQFTLTINLEQQSGETDVAYWRRLQSYQIPSGLDINLTAEYQSGNPALLSNPDPAKPPFFRFHNLSSPLQALLSSAFDKAAEDKCIWTKEEPWLYELILSNYNGNNVDERLESAGCNPKPPLPSYAYYPLFTKFPNYSKQGKVFFDVSDAYFRYEYAGNLIDFRKASTVQFRWLSAEQAISSSRSFSDAVSFDQFQWLHDRINRNPQHGYLTAPPSSYQCRVLLKNQRPSGESIASEVKRSWAGCAPGVRYDMPPLSGNQFYVFELRGVTADGPSKNVSSVSWKPIDSGKCLLSDVRTRFFIYRGQNTKQNAVRMVARYKASRAGRVKVSYFQRGRRGKIGKRLGILNARFYKTGRKQRDGYKFFRIRQQRRPALMRKLRSQRFGFVAKMRVKNAPGYCNTYYKTDIQLTTLKRFYGQYTWFQKGSFKKRKWDFVPLTASGNKKN